MPCCCLEGGTDDTEASVELVVFGGSSLACCVHKHRRRWIALALVFLAAGALLWSGIYLNNRGFVRKWRNLLAGELARSGVEVITERLTLSPFSGLTARGIVLRDGNEDRTPLVFFDQAVLDIDLPAMALRRPFLRRAQVRDGVMVIPDANGGFSAGRPVLVAVELDAVFSPELLRLKQFRAVFPGVFLQASARVTLPVEQGWQSGFAEVLRVGMETLAELRTEDKPAQIVARIDRDPMGEWSGYLNFVGTQLVWRDVQLDSVKCMVTLQNEYLRLQNAEIHSAEGWLLASADRGMDGTIAFRMKGRADLALLGIVGLDAAAESAGVHYVDLDLSGEWREPHSGIPEISGSIRLIGNDSLPFTISADVAFQEGRWAIRNGTAEAAEYEGGFQFLMEEADFRFRVDRAIIPLFSSFAISDSIRAWFSQNVQEESQFIEGRGASPDPATWKRIRGER